VHFSQRQLQCLALFLVVVVAGIADADVNISKIVSVQNERPTRLVRPVPTLNLPANPGLATGLYRWITVKVGYQNSILGVVHETQGIVIH
jgi:hypothetical protein